MIKNFRLLKLGIAGLHIILGLTILYAVSVSTVEYYRIFSLIPLIDDYSVIEITIRKNLFLFVHGLISLYSGILLFKGILKGWVLSIITWMMTAILFCFSYLRQYLTYPEEMSSSLTTVYILLILTSLVLAFTVGYRVLYQKYKVTKKVWLIIFISIFAFIAVKLFYN